MPKIAERGNARIVPESLFLNANSVIITAFLVRNIIKSSTSEAPFLSELKNILSNKRQSMKPETVEKHL